MSVLGVNTPDTQTASQRGVSLHFALFGEWQFELLSPLPPDECVRRVQTIAARTNRRPSMRFKLRVHRPRLLRRHWTVVISRWLSPDPRTHIRMWCVISDDGRMSRIRCHFSTAGILPLAFGMALVGVGLFLQPTPIGIRCAELALMAAMFVGAMIWLRPDAAIERRKMLKFLRRAIAAQEVTIERARR